VTTQILRSDRIAGRVTRIDEILDHYLRGPTPNADSDGAIMAWALTAREPDGS
jgi:hypothetical protein